MIDNEITRIKTMTLSGCAPRDIKKELERERKIEKTKDILEEAEIPEPKQEIIVDKMYPTKD